jgi:NAD(P)-dependent dehydrogenase (short-subunit alcohol dehydrogenase family)
MAVSLKSLHRQTLVITGASSGIGLATARAAAQKGAKVVLASRNGEALAQIERDIKASGGQAIHVVADVGFRDQVQQIADVARARFGSIDTWVNNAGLSIWGRLEQVSDEDHHRLFQTNFWGVVYGSLIAAKILQERGGAIINVGSIVSDMAVPIQGMYAASKHAVKGFTDALRLELEEAGAPISVTLIKPSAINTPFPQHARNYTDKEPKLPPPVYPPEEVAHAILYAASHPVRDIYVGGGGRMMTALNHYLPRAMDWLNEKMMVKEQFRNEPARHREGALYQAGQDGHAHGDHPGYVMKTSAYTRAATHPLLTGLLLASAGVALAAWLGSNSSQGQRT